ncbi:MAG: hypothetical protein NC078_04430 [Ruminococcus sp.]|nr:hypothetical protein [Ruminococcus sp.]
MKRNILSKTVAALTAVSAVAAPLALNISAETMAEWNERMAAAVIETGDEPLAPVTTSHRGYAFHIAAGEGGLQVKAENGSFALPFLFENTGKDVSFRVHILAGGIAQSYSCETAEPAESMTFTVKSGETLETVFYTENITLSEDMTGREEVPLTVVLTPCIEQEHNRIYGMGDPYFPPVKLTLHSNSSDVCTAKIMTGGSSHKITDSEDIRFAIGKDYMDNTRRFVLAPHSTRHFDALLPSGDNGTVQIRLNAYTTYKTDTPEKYRLSIYKNGEHTSFNNGCDYLDVALESGMMTAEDITLEAAPGDWLICAAVPLDGLDRQELRPEISPVTTVLAPEDMPEELPAEDYYFPIKLSPEQEKIYEEQIRDAMREAGVYGVRRTKQ